MNTNRDIIRTILNNCIGGCNPIGRKEDLLYDILLELDFLCRMPGYYSTTDRGTAWLLADAKRIQHSHFLG